MKLMKTETNNKITNTDQMIQVQEIELIMNEDTTEVSVDDSAIEAAMQTSVNKMNEKQIKY